MKKILRRLVTILLCAVLILAVSVTAFAADNENIKKYSDYCCIGDSISCGFTWQFGSLNYNNNFNEDGSNPNQTRRAHYGNLPEKTFGDIIRDTTEAKLHSLACVGQQLTDVAWILGAYENDEDYPYDEAYNYHYVHQNQANRWNAIKYMHDSGEAINRVRKSSLITILLGSNDLFTYPMNYSRTADGIDFAQFIRMMIEGYGRYVDLYPRIINRIQEINPVAEIVVVSLFNPYANTQFTADDTMHLAGRLVGTYMDNANLKLKTWANLYGCKFVDVREIEEMYPTLNLSSGDLISEFSRLETHPPIEGHAIMGKNIIAALPTNETRINSFADGLVRLSFNDENAGLFVLRQTKNKQWTIRTDAGQYVCIDDDKVVLRSDKPTTWSYSDGAITSNGMYLNYADSKLCSSKESVAATVYRQN